MKTYLEPSEIGLMIDTSANLRDKLLICLLFHLGCRVSEALALTVGDIDFDHGTITIQHLKSRIRLSCPECEARLSASHTFCPTCGSRVAEAIVEQKEHRRQRTLPIDPDTLVMLKVYLKSGGLEMRGGKRLIFGINRHRAWQIVKEGSAKAMLSPLVNPETGKQRGISPHRLRDAFAVHAVKINDSGDGLRLLQEHLGHASFNTTARYRKVAGEEHRQWYEKLWNRDDSACGRVTEAQMG